MLSKISQDHQDCLRRAADCRLKAEEANDPLVRDDMLAMEQRWLKRAESYANLQRLEISAASLRPDLEGQRTYRVLTIGRDGQYLGAPSVVTSRSDEQAIERVRAIKGSFTREIWEGQRLVGRVPPETA
jgi:hypothetical protein